MTSPLSPLAAVDRRRTRLGWSLLRLSREAGVSYMKCYRGSIDATDRARLERALDHAEQQLVAAILAG